MPRTGYGNITLSDKVLALIDKYIEEHKRELEIKGLDSRSAIVRQAIWVWAKQEGILIEDKGE